ncbi:MAG: Bacterial Ig-like domain (group 2) [Bacteroidetes bacterium ADurb.Bin408]|nr:MAG: Bacterial Ig-like domain (group 2) [Bacteroidetes bacterium ADurb.Bin408]
MILYNDSMYKMYAFGTSSNGQIIRSLTSNDGNIWTLDSTVNLIVYPAGGVEDMDVWAPTVVKLNDTSFIMIYETRIPVNAATNPSDLVVTPPGNITLNVGDSLQFVAKAFYNDNSNRDISFFGTWHSSSPAIASINTTGYLSAIAPGITAVYITYQGLSDTTWITVSPSTNIERKSNQLPVVNLYPNPVKEMLYVDIGETGCLKVYLKITNTFGQIVLQETISESQYIKLPLPSGIYYVTANNGHNVITSKIAVEK